MAAILPGAPMTPPPGCAPDPQSSRFLTGVPGPGLVSVVGLARYSWSRDMDPWNMFPVNYKLKHCLFLHNIFIFILPPVNPKTLSSSGGGRTSLPTILALNPGAYLPCRIKCYKTIRAILTFFQPFHSVKYNIGILLPLFFIPWSTVRVVGSKLSKEETHMVAWWGKCRVQ